MGPDDAETAYNDLCEILNVSPSIDDDDALALRLADIRIELDALAVMKEGNVPAEASELKAIELVRRVTELAMEVLGYYALLDESSGTNEPEPGNLPAREIQSAYLEALAHDEVYVMELKDALVSLIEKTASRR